MTPAQLDKLIPEITISKFLQAQAPKGYTINKVNVYTSKYFKALAPILKSVDRKTLHDYFEWGLVRAWLDGLHKDFAGPLVKFQASKGVKDADFTGDRYKTCLGEMDTELGWIGSALFVQKAFSKEGKELGERIVGDVKNVYAEKLATPSWLSDVAKAASLNKGKIKPFFHRLTKAFAFNYPQMDWTQLTRLS
jgi:endothelin-converting enzyme